MDQERVLDRLRRDHPDPKLREQFCADGKLEAYVRVLVPDASDAEVVALAAAVHAADDGTTGPMTSNG